MHRITELPHNAQSHEFMQKYLLTCREKTSQMLVLEMLQPNVEIQQPRLHQNSVKYAATETEIKRIRKLKWKNKKLSY